MGVNLGLLEAIQEAHDANARFDRRFHQNKNGRDALPGCGEYAAPRRREKAALLTLNPLVTD